MALDRQNAQIPFSQGVDTKTDPKQVRLGKLLTLENGFLLTPQSIRKRYGYTALTQTVSTKLNTTFSITAVSSGAHVSSFQNELNQADGSFFYSYSPSSPAAQTLIGTYCPTKLSVTTGVRDLAGERNPDVCRHPTAGTTAWVFETLQTAPGHSAGQYIQITDTTTGALLFQGALSGTTRAKVLAIGNYFIVMSMTPNLVATRYLAAYPFTTGVSLTFPNSHATNLAYDATVINNRLFVAYNDNTGANGQFRIGYTDSTLGSVLGSATIASDASGAVGVFGTSGNNVWVCWVPKASGSTASHAVYDNSLGVVLTANPYATSSGLTKNVTGCAISATQAVLFAEYDQGLAADQARQVSVGTFDNTGASLIQSYLFYGRGLASKPVFYNNCVFVNTVYGGSLQATYFTEMFSTQVVAHRNYKPAVVAKISPGTSGGLTFYNILPEFANTSGSTFQVAFLQKDLLVPVGGTIFTQNGVFAANLTLNVNAQQLQIGGSAVLGGGCVYSYDGASITEQNFHLYPEIASSSQSNMGGSITGNATYQYIVVYEWMDNQGQINQSAPSVATSIAVANGTNTNTCTVTVYNLRITSKSNVSIVLYRTTANGSTFYRVTPITTLNFSATNADSSAITDGLADTAIIGNEQLYTNGGEVQNGSPPPALAITTYKNRVIVVDAANTNTWAYSKQLIPGVPVEFSPFFTQNIDQRSGPTTTVSVLDDKLIFFKDASIIVVVGDGPAVSGAGNDFSAGTLITTDTGCPAANIASVVVMGDGIMYQSGKGIELLDRSLNTHYIGADVEGDLGGNTIVSATLYAAYSQVRFVLSNGTALVYDYYNKDPNTGIGQWSVYTNHAAVAACLFQGAYTYVNSAGLVFQESASVFTDNGAFVSLKAVTSWLQLANIQGFERIRELEILGTWKSAHNLVVQVAYDFSSTYVQTDTIPSASTITPYQYRVHLARQKCEALQILIQDQNSGTPAESMSLSSLGLVVGVKKGLNKLPAAQSFG